MVAYTTAKGLAQVANSSYIGTWDVPTNANWAAVDAAAGQVSSINLSGGNLSLTATQMGCSQLTFNSTLTGNTVVTFPVAIPSSAPATPITGPYIVYNACTGSSAYTVTLATTVAGGLSIALPSGELVDVVTDGTNFRFKNLGRVGTYWDYAGSSVPNWVSACTTPPYLNCDGTTFSSATYPFLATILGGTTLPDAKGRFRLTLDQGAGRVTTAGSSVDGNTIFASGGSQYIQSHNHGGTTGATTPSWTGNPTNGSNIINGTANTTLNGGTGGVQSNSFGGVTPSITLQPHTHTIDSSGAGNSQNMPPTYVGGITMVRAG